MTNQKEPSFLGDNQSVASLVSQLHNYFKNSYSQYKAERSAFLSRLESADAEKEKELVTELRKIEAEQAIFGALSDALSVADRLLHARAVMNELGINSEIYTVHHDKNQGS